MSTLIKVTLGIITFVGVILLVVLLPLSIKHVNNGQYAIVYHDVSNHVEDRVLSEGRHVLTPDNHLYKFTRKFITSDTPITCLSNDGLYISVVPVIQYQLNKGRLLSSFRNLGEQGKIKRYTNAIIESSTRDACSLFTAEKFYTNRGDVERQIANQFYVRVNSSKFASDASKFETEENLLNSEIPSVNPKTLSSGGLASGIDPGFVQLKNFELPKELLLSIEQGQLALEDVSVAETERDEKLIVAQTAQIREIQNNQIKLLNGKTLSDSVLYKAQEQVFSRESLWEKLTFAFLSDMEGLDLTAEEYVSYFLLPKATLNVLPEKTRACLTSCLSSGGTGVDCWFCWINASPSVVIST